MAFHWYPVRELQFQSTSSSRSQTNPPVSSNDPLIDFNPLAPHGARQGIIINKWDISMDFNPLAPHGARHLYPGKPMISVRFQSTSSSRSQTAMLIHDDRQLHLFQSTSSSRSQTVAFHWYPVRELQFQSTSSSRSQTAYQFRRIKKNAYFNPLAPHGARHKIMQDSSDQKLFQSTSSSRSQTRMEQY